jgi:ABC-type cobalamin/Fe3+-siderophores transport system ATPase subunit
MELLRKAQHHHPADFWIAFFLGNWQPPAGDPDLIFLDEPTVGLDTTERVSLWEILRELHVQGRTIVMSTHYIEEAQ